MWDVQDGRRIRQVMLNSLPQGPISCLNWIGEEPGATAPELIMVIILLDLLMRKDLDVDFDPAQYLPHVKAIGRKYGLD